MNNAITGLSITFSHYISTPIIYIHKKWVLQYPTLEHCLHPPYV